MTARDRLVEALKSPGLVGLRDEEADELVANFAHELAELQRLRMDELDLTGQKARIVGRIVDLIDPHVSAGPVRPDEEKTA